MSRTSAYVPLLFRGIEARYRPVYRQQGLFADAIAALAGGRRTIVHIHWEEFVLRACEDEQAAEAAAVAFERSLLKVKAQGGAIFWTVHNEAPHLIGYHRSFPRLRGFLARVADAVLVHSTAALGVLSTQVALDRSKLHLLPHPSYLDEFEDEATLLTGLDATHRRIIQGFGWIRVQKGFGAMIAALPTAFLEETGAKIRISGEGVEASAVIAENPGRDDVVWDLRHVPGCETPALLREACCVVLPYTSVMTSGVALLAMSVGVPLVAVDIPLFRALLAPENLPYLYPRGNADACRSCIADALSLSAVERRRVVEANLALARQLHPRRIAQDLACLYDNMSG